MTTTALSIVDIPVDRLAQHPDNVRRHLGDLGELTKSIAGVGVLEPLGVLPDDDGTHLVVMGNRRLAAAIKAGVDTVPCMIRDLSPLEVLEVMLVENLQRAEITPVEEAHAYARLIELDSTPAKIAKRVGRSQAHVKGRLALTQLPDKVLTLVEDGTITLTDAADLVPYAADDQAMTLLANDWPRDRHVVSWLETRLTELAREEAMAEAIDRLEERGIARYVPGTSTYFYAGATVLSNVRQPAPVAALGLAKGDPTKHQHEPCHAVHLGQSYGKVDVERTTVCLKPIRHTPDAPDSDRSSLQIPGYGQDTHTEPERDVTPEQAERAARQEAWRAADEHRITFWTTWLNTVTATIDPLTASYIGLFTDGSWDAYTRLGHESPNDGDTVDHLASLLTDAKDPIAAAVMAHVTAGVVGRLNRNHYDGDHTVVAADLLERLIADGYTPTDIEAEWLHEVRNPAPDVDDMELSDEITDLLPKLLATQLADGDLAPIFEDPSQFEDLHLRGLLAVEIEAGTGPRLSDLGVQVAEILTTRTTEET